MPPLGEFELIARYFDRDGRVELGIGDDAAVLRCSGRIAVAVDTLVDGVHFPRGFPADAVGHRALAVNVSDIAAMGLAPRWFTLALTLPVADEDWLGQFADGLFALADRYDLVLVGGDTTRGPLTVTVQIIADAGTMPVLTRSGARPGDGIWVTGTLGDAAAVWRSAVEPLPDAVVERFRWPAPRVEAGVALRGIANAAIDISDGLVADLGHVCEASGCGADVDVTRLPVSAVLADAVGLDAARRLAIGGGDDYELCVTVPAEREPELERLLATSPGVAPLTLIGRCTDTPGLRFADDGRPFRFEDSGYRHF